MERRLGNRAGGLVGLAEDPLAGQLVFCQRLPEGSGGGRRLAALRVEIGVDQLLPTGHVAIGRHDWKTAGEKSGQTGTAAGRERRRRRETLRHRRGVLDDDQDVMALHRGSPLPAAR